MTTPTAATPSVEERLSAIESRMAALEAVMTLFIEEQREHRREVNARFNKIEEDQREHRREVNARFNKIEEDQREHRREVNARFDRLEARMDRQETRINQVAASIPRMLYAVIGIVGALAVGLMVSNVIG